MTTIYVGIDVSKETLDVACLQETSCQYHPFTNDKQGIAALLKWLLAKAANYRGSSSPIFEFNCVGKPIRMSCDNVAGNKGWSLRDCLQQISSVLQ